MDKCTDGWIKDCMDAITCRKDLRSRVEYTVSDFRAESCSAAAAILASCEKVPPVAAIRFVA